MPRTKKVHRSRGRRSRYKKNYTKQLRLRTPVPRKLITKLRYYDSFSINAGLGAAASHVFSANGLYDPNITGTGHQPRGLDQLFAMYDHAVCLGSKITVFFDNRASARMVGGIYVKDNATTTTDPINLMEMGKVKSTVLNGVGAPQQKLSVSVNPNKFLGRSKPLADSELKTGIGNNPSEQCYFHCFAYSPNASDDPGAVYCTVVIDYIVALIEPKQPTMS